MDYKKELKLKGITRIQLYDFLLEDDEEKEDFINVCRGMNSFQIRRYAGKIREKKIRDRNYSEEQFVKAYKVDRPSALSELFMELVSPDKAELLKLDNPYEIFSIHSKCSKDIYFVKFLLAVR